jgi:hypothetical protein
MSERCAKCEVFLQDSLSSVNILNLYEGLITPKRFFSYIHMVAPYINECATIFSSQIFFMIKNSVFTSYNMAYPEKGGNCTILDNIELNINLSMNLSRFFETYDACKENGIACMRDVNIFKRSEVEFIYESLWISLLNYFMQVHDEIHRLH